MKFKKILLSIVSVAILFAIAIQNVSMASTAPSVPVTFAILPTSNTDFSYSNGKFGYAIGDPGPGGSGLQMWNIGVKANSTATPTLIDAYCARAGRGFGSSTGTINTSNNSETYNNKFDMKNSSDRNQIENTYSHILPAAKTVVKDNVTTYDAILQLSNLLYLRYDDNETENYKDELMVKAVKKYGNVDFKNNDYDYKITDDDIVAVQQAALWYFTNYDETKYNKLESTDWLYYTTDGNTWTQIVKIGNQGQNDLDSEGFQRNDQAEALYKYLINTAIENAKSNVQVTNKVTLYTNVNTISQTQPVIVIEKAKITGEYGVKIVKVDSESGNKLSGAVFTVNNEDKTATNSNGETVVEENKEITSEGQTDVYTITEKTAPEGYNKFEGTIKVTVKTKLENGSYVVDTQNTTMEVKDKNGTVITTNVPVSIDKTTGLITITVKDTPIPIEGQYGVKIVKVDSESGDKLSGAVFTVNNEDKTATNSNGETVVEENKKIESEGQTDTYTITEKTAPEGYNKFEGTIKVTVKTKKENGNYVVDTQNTTMEVKDKNGTVITTKLPVSIDKTTGLITITVKDSPIPKGGKYNITLVKEDADGEQLNSKATFEVNGEEKEVVGKLEIAKDVPITEENLGTPDVYTIKELVPPDEYCKFNGTITITVNKKQEDNKFLVDGNPQYKVTDENGNDITEQSKGKVDVYLNEAGNIYVEVKNYQFDLKLIKRIVEVNGKEVNNRITGVDISKLADGTETTADYKMIKDPVKVKKGDIVKYTFRVYNEGEIDGYATELTEDIPEGLEFIYSTNEGTELENDNTLTDAEKEAIKFNQSQLWTYNKDKISEDGKIQEIKTDYLSKKVSDDNLIKAFDKTKAYSDTDAKNPDYKEVSVMLKVITDETEKIIRNEAEISDDSDANGDEVTDRDSKPELWGKEDSDKYYDNNKKWHVYKEDDEDYDNIIIEKDIFDLALRKFIIAVSKDETIENKEYLKNEDGTYTRAPKVDTSKLNTEDEKGNIITTAIYNHTKEPVQVQKGDYVVYTLRVYNEGSKPGYAAEIKDHLPEFLEFVDGEYNKKYGWEISKDGRTVTTKYLADDKYKIEAATTDSEGKVTKLDYKDVPIMCKVKDTAKTGEKITNIADITKYEDEEHKEVEDRDSKSDNVKVPEDKELPSYKDDEKGSYIPGQEDDDDFEKVIIKKFDLALRKFITKVDDKEVTTRIPQLSMGEDGNIKYNHPKDPVDVVNGNIVTYTLRIFNEGEINGYASVITDDVPDGLEFLPDNSLNKEMRWVMYEEVSKDTKVEDESKIVECDGKKYIETTDASKAAIIRTDYLSKEQGEERMKKDEKIKENPNLLKAFDSSKELSDTNPDHKDVQIAFKVIEPNGSDRVIINYAQISDDKDEEGKDVDDIDSIPNKWNEGEDDQDIEKIRVPIFDLALRKWVTQAIVIENGKQTVTNTGHDAWDDPEAIVKVELHRKKLSDVTVKFKYSIRVYNQGELEGYAKEVTDYIPQGLKFVASDNPGWTDEGNNVISTRLLENTLLKPGEYADVEVVLTWINGQNNMGLKVNTAEISEDYNEKGVKDKDSTPDNKKPGEDDIDDAPVMLSISTGKEKVFITLGITILITIAGGIVLIKKYVL